MRAQAPTLMGAVLFVAATAALRADDDYPVLVYPCPKVQHPPKIDGSLSDACWESVPVVSGFTFYNKPAKVAVQTSLRVAYDDRCLYFAVRCEEPKMRLVNSTPTARDSTGVFRQEAIEIFVDPDHSHSRYYQFAFCSAGTYYDSMGQDAAWDSHSLVGAQEHEDSWTLEVAIPWADMAAVAKPGKVVGFNVCRDRQVDRAGEWSNWSQTKANFHDPDRFAHLVLSGTDEVIGRLEAVFRKGGRTGELRVFGHAGYSQTAYAALAKQAVADLDKLMGDLAATARRESSADSRRGIEARIADMKKRLAPHREAASGAGAIDAVQWHRMGRALNGMKLELGRVLWEARLQALLDGI